MRVFILHIQGREKILHWPLQSEAAVASLVQYPEWLQRNNWVCGFDAKTFDVMLQLVHSFDETGAVHSALRTPNTKHPITPTHRALIVTPTPTLAPSPHSAL